MVCKSREYKKTLKNQFNEFQKAFVSKLRGLRTTDPKSYWSLLNKGCDKGKNVSQKVFYNHFKDLNNVEDDIDAVLPENMSEYNTVINQPICEQEVVNAIKSLKNNKACSDDMIINEFLKHAACKLREHPFNLKGWVRGGGRILSANLLEKFFSVSEMGRKIYSVSNLCLKNYCFCGKLVKWMFPYACFFWTTLYLRVGLYPIDSWSNGFICPIYKQKGDPANADNYRGITILSCYGKLFTCVLNNRLFNYLESLGLLSKEQAGFRKAYDTVDHIFNLECLIDLYLLRRQKLYCAFVDYRKAFDSVNRVLLWQKMLRNGIDGKLLTVLQNLYQNAKSCVRGGSNCSDFFASNIGVRQGENMSPLFFSIYLNDLTEFMSHAYSDLKAVCNISHLLFDNDDIEVYCNFCRICSRIAIGIKCNVLVL